MVACFGAKIDCALHTCVAAGGIAYYIHCMLSFCSSAGETVVAVHFRHACTNCRLQPLTDCCQKQPYG